MTLDINGTLVTIGDNSPEAQKIEEGYDYHIENGKLIIDGIGKNIKNKFQATQAINNAQNIDELKQVLIRTIKKLL